MVKKIHPTAIVVCGKVPAWLPKRHPNIRIIHIQSYSEMWHEREKRKLIGRRKPSGITTILKGGYGGASGKARRKKDGCYFDSHNVKVTETEVKGVVSLNPGQIAKQIRHASKQISDELARRSEDEQLPNKIVLISLHEVLKSASN